MKLFSKGPLIFHQKRAGKGKKTFTIYKIRTMVEDAEKLKKNLLRKNEADGPVFKIHDDPRYTKIGRFLSHTGLDELPQLINIIKGEMAFVGPRPLPVEEAEKVPEKYKDRFSVLPGISSPWVVNGTHQLSFRQWMELDVRYARHRSALKDLSIALQTIRFLAILFVRTLAGCVSRNNFQAKRSVFIASNDLLAPVIRSGDLISFKKVRFSSIKTNDIVMLYSARRPYLSRIIYYNSRMAVSQAGNRSRVLTSTDTIGKVITIKRGQSIERPELFPMTQSFIYLREINRLDAAFRRQDINYAILKGVPLHMHYKQSMPGRLFADCDILVDPRHSHRAQQILRRLGFRRHTGDINLPEYTYRKQSHSLPVTFDFHTTAVFQMTRFRDAFYPRNQLEQFTRSLLAEKRDIVVNGQPLPILSPSGLTVYLLLHFFHHNCTGIHRLELLNTIIIRENRTRQFTGDVSAIIDAYRLSQFVAAPLVHLKRWYPQTRPFTDAVTNTIALSPVQRLACTCLVKRNVFNEDGRLAGGITRFMSLFFLGPVSWQQKLAGLFSIPAWKTAGSVWLERKKALR